MRLSTDELLRRPVRVKDIRLGQPVDVILARADGRRALGLDVLCGDLERRFLPLAAAEVAGEQIAVSSALTLLDDAELAYYQERGSTLRSLRGAVVRRRRRPVGLLKDLVLAADGSIDAVVVETSRGRAELEYGPDVELPSPLRAGS